MWRSSQRLLFAGGGGRLRDGVRHAVTTRGAQWKPAGVPLLHQVGLRMSSVMDGRQMKSAKLNDLIQKPVGPTGLVPVRGEMSSRSRTNPVVTT